MIKNYFEPLHLISPPPSSTNTEGRSGINYPQFIYNIISAVGITTIYIIPLLLVTIMLCWLLIHYDLKNIIYLNPPAPDRRRGCEHSWKDIGSNQPNLVHWRCSGCNSGPHIAILECVYCKTKRCRNCTLKR